MRDKNTTSTYCKPICCKKVDQRNKRGSNFNIERVSRFVLSICPYHPLYGSTFVRTPDVLANKHCLINVQNNDEKCFIWSVLSAVYPAAHNPQRLSKYKNQEHSLKVEGLNFLVQTKQIALFEKLNPSISVNVLAFEESSRGFTVEYRSPEREREHQVNLSLLEDADNPSKRHYVWIKNMSALVCHRTKHTEKQHVCNSCLHPFMSQRVLDSHIPYCIQHEPQRVVYPNPQNEKECVLKFRSKHKQHPLPFYLVCDFESFLTPLEKEEEEERNSMKKLDVHSVSGFCCYRISSEPKYRTPPKLYSGPDPMTEFYDHVMEESRVLSKIVSHQVGLPMRPMTFDEHKLHEAARECVNCGGPFSDRNLKVHHHDHVCGEYLFPACQKM